MLHKKITFAILIFALLFAQIGAVQHHAQHWIDTTYNVNHDKHTGQSPCGDCAAFSLLASGALPKPLLLLSYEPARFDFESSTYNLPAMHLALVHVRGPPLTA